MTDEALDKLFNVNLVMSADDLENVLSLFKDKTLIKDVKLENLSIGTKLGVINWIPIVNNNETYLCYAVAIDHNFTRDQKFFVQYGKVVYSSIETEQVLIEWDKDGKKRLQLFDKSFLDQYSFSIFPES